MTSYYFLNIKALRLDISIINKMSDNQLATEAIEATEVTESFLALKQTVYDSINLSKAQTDIEQSESTTHSQLDEQFNSTLNLTQTTNQDVSEQPEIESVQMKLFEEAFYKYYVDSSQNSNGNFDNYLTSGLKLISLMPEQNNQSEIKEKSVALPQNTQKSKTLILDLDETLIHSDLDSQYRYHDEILKFRSDDDEEVNLPLIVRPGLIEFLDFAVEHFEVVVFTASYQYYADAILDYIEKDKKYFSMRLYRTSCLFQSPGIYIKDLSIFSNRSLKDIVIIDNSIFSFANQLDNGILVTSFYNDQEDSFLLNLIQYLQYMICPSDDVRDVNRESFRFEEYKAEMINQERSNVPL